MTDAQKEMRKVLMGGINATQLSMAGFERLQGMLKAIRHIAADNPHAVTLVDESLLIADDFLNMSDVDREQFQRAWDAAAQPEAAEVSHV